MYNLRILENLSHFDYFNRNIVENEDLVYYLQSYNKFSAASTEPLFTFLFRFKLDLLYFFRAITLWLYAPNHKITATLKIFL